MDWLQESYPTHWYLFYSKAKQALQRRQRILAYCQLLRKDIQAFPDSSLGKESACNAGDPSSIAGSGRSPGEGIGYPLLYSGLENSMNCIVHGVPKSWTWLSDFHFHISYLNYPVPHGMLTLKSFLRIWFCCNPKRPEQICCFVITLFVSSVTWL